MGYTSVFLNGGSVRATVHQYEGESHKPGEGFLVLGVGRDELTIHNVTPSILGQLANRLLGLAEQLSGEPETPADQVAEVEPATGHDATPDATRRGCQHVNHGESPCDACYSAAVGELSDPLSTDLSRQVARETVSAYDAAAMNDIHSTRDTSNTELD